MPQLEYRFNTSRARIRGFRNAILVFLDLEYIESGGNITQIGISTLDTQHLAQVDINDVEPIYSMFSNRLYRLPGSRLPHRKCHHRYDDPFSAKGLTLQDVLISIFIATDASTPENQKTNQDRNFILAGHSIHADLLMLERCGLDLSEIPKYQDYHRLPRQPRTYSTLTRTTPLNAFVNF